MPWFRRTSDDEQRRLDEAQQNQEASIASLERGGIPVQAERRLRDLASHPGFFTSDLSVNEFALSQDLGARPLSLVMGSCFYHVGWQRLPGQRWFPASSELEVVSAAFNEARQRALHRMEEEAALAGANAVAGVRVLRSGYDWAGDLVEFQVVGTAIREPGPHQGPPALTNLSVQDFWTLRQAGYRPRGVVAATMVYYVVAGWRTYQATSTWWGSRANQELRDFTQGMYTARHLAMQRVRAQAAALGAEGIVGMEIVQSEDEYEVNLGNDQERTDMIVTFHVMGTAIERATERHVLPRVGLTVDLRDGKE